MYGRPPGQYPPSAPYPPSTVQSTPGQGYVPFAGLAPTQPGAPYNTPPQPYPQPYPQQYPPPQQQAYPPQQQPYPQQYTPSQQYPPPPTVINAVPGAGTTWAPPDPLSVPLPKPVASYSTVMNTNVPAGGYGTVGSTPGLAQAPPGGNPYATVGSTPGVQGGAPYYPPGGY